MKINEIFESIQGEGKYSGKPSLFLRMSGCNLACQFCDTEYKTGEHYHVDKIVDVISRSKKEIIVWTGGEPTLQLEEIIKVINRTKNKNHHLESNGHILDNRLNSFDYLCFSPKNIQDAERTMKFGRGDVKIVTDLELNLQIIPYANMLMPLTTFDKNKDLEIERKVWNYCVENNLEYSPRLHINLWSGERGK